MRRLTPPPVIGLKGRPGDATSGGKTGGGVNRRWALALGLIAVAGIALVGWARAQYVVPVLMYHEIDPRPSAESRLIVSPQGFARQMAFLHRTGASVVPLAEVVEAFHAGRPLSSRAVAVTFDDGFTNTYTEAWPVLQRERFPATVFIVTGWIGRPGYLTWAQIRDLDHAGLTIGSHSVSHPWMPALDDAALQREVVESKRVLEAGLGHSVDLFCYPMGAFDARVRRAVQAAGYRGACATNPGRAWSSRDPYAVKRLRISHNAESLPVFWVESSGYYTWSKEYRKQRHQRR